MTGRRRFWFSVSYAVMWAVTGYCVASVLDVSLVLLAGSLAGVRRPPGITEAIESVGGVLRVLAAVAAFAAAFWWAYHKVRPKDPPPTRS